MKKIVLSTLMLGASIGVGSVALAANQNFDGQDNANIVVNGTLGADNTKANAGIDEGQNDWINVSLDTATIFYNKAGKTDITSPQYNIENKSGRPVEVAVGNFSHKDGSDPSTDIKSLKLNVTNTGSNQTVGSDLFSAPGTIKDPNTDALLTLANDEGVTAKGGAAVPNSNKATYNFSGEVNSALKTMSKPSFDLNLKFKAVAWAYDEPSDPNAPATTPTPAPSNP